MAGPGDFLSPDMWPLFLQSGMMDVPHGVRPTVPIDLENSEPGAAAAYRMQQAVRPDFGRPGEGPTIPQVLMSAMPGGMGARVIQAMQAFPKTAAATLGLTGLSTSASEAGEQPFNWEDSNKDRLKEIQALEKRINDRADQITKLGTTSTKSPAGTQAKAIDNLSKLNAPDAPDVQRLNQLRQEQKADRESALADAIAQKRANTSWFDMFPGTRTAITLGALPLSYMAGRFAGSKLPPYAAIPTAAAIEGGIGALTQYIPTEVDMGLPRNAPARQQAAQDLTDPEYWKRLGVMGGANAGVAAVGAAHKWLSRLPALGAILSRSERGSLPPSPMAPMNPTLGGGPGMPGMMSAPSTLPSAAPLPSPAPIPALPAPKPPPRILIQRTDKLGRDYWFDQATGNRVKKPPTLGLD